MRKTCWFMGRLSMACNGSVKITESIVLIETVYTCPVFNGIPIKINRYPDLVYRDVFPVFHNIEYSIYTDRDETSFLDW